MNARSLTSLIASMTLAAVPMAQEAPKIQRDATTIILPAGNYEIAPLIDEIAAFLQWNVLYSETELKMSPGPVVLQTKQMLTQDSAEEVFYELLHSHGFVVQPRDPAKKLY